MSRVNKNPIPPPGLYKLTRDVNKNEREKGEEHFAVFDQHGEVLLAHVFSKADADLFAAAPGLKKFFETADAMLKEALGDQFCSAMGVHLCLAYACAEIEVARIKGSDERDLLEALKKYIAMARKAEEP